ncbi:hypothetical protein A2U01_0093775, partial [Trifolium medium]|nr:hypothetical protein [Trifolium medium]
MIDSNQHHRVDTPPLPPRPHGDLQVGRTTVSSFQCPDSVELNSLNLSHYGNDWDFADVA